jgi:hypothetical protein
LLVHIKEISKKKKKTRRIFHNILVLTFSLQQRYVAPRMKLSLQTFYGRHYGLVDCYEISLSQMTGYFSLSSIIFYLLCTESFRYFRPFLWIIKLCRKLCCKIRITWLLLCCCYFNVLCWLKRFITKHIGHPWTVDRYLHGMMNQNVGYSLLGVCIPFQVLNRECKTPLYIR